MYVFKHKYPHYMYRSHIGIYLCTHKHMPAHVHIPVHMHRHNYVNVIAIEIVVLHIFVAYKYT